MREFYQEKINYNPPKFPLKRVTYLFYYLSFMKNTTNFNQFQENLTSYVEQVIKNHSPLKVTNNNGDDFIVISLED